jgi:hypothetical protein
LLFEQISAGDASTCAWTSAGAAYCRGFNVGPGLDTRNLTPRGVMRPN